MKEEELAELNRDIARDQAASHEAMVAMRSLVSENLLKYPLNTIHTLAQLIEPVLESNPELAPLFVPR